MILTWHLWSSYFSWAIDPWTKAFFWGGFLWWSDCFPNIFPHSSCHECIYSGIFLDLALTSSFIILSSWTCFHVDIMLLWDWLTNNPDSLSFEQVQTLFCSCDKSRVIPCKHPWRGEFGGTTKMHQQPQASFKRPRASSPCMDIVCNYYLHKGHKEMDSHWKKFSHLCITQTEADVHTRLNCKQCRIKGSHKIKGCKCNLLNLPLQTTSTIWHNHRNSIQYELAGLVNVYFCKKFDAIPYNCSKKHHKCLVKQIVYEIDQMYHQFKQLENLTVQLIASKVCGEMAHAADESFITQGSIIKPIPSG